MGLLSPSYKKIMKNRQSISTNCEQMGYQKEIERLKKNLKRIKEITEITEFRDSYQKLILIRDIVQKTLKGG